MKPEDYRENRGADTMSESQSDSQPDANENVGTDSNESPDAGSDTALTIPINSDTNKNTVSVTGSDSEAGTGSDTLPNGETDTASTITTDSDPLKETENETDSNTETYNGTDSEINTGFENNAGSETDITDSDSCVCRAGDVCCDGCSLVDDDSECEFDGDYMTVDLCDAGRCQPGANYCEEHSCWHLPPTGQHKCYDNEIEIDCAECDTSLFFCDQDAHIEYYSRTFTCRYILKMFCATMRQTRMKPFSTT